MGKSIDSHDIDDMEKIRPLHNNNNEEEEDEVDRYTSNLIPTTDDPTLPSLTFRVMLLGTFWAIVLGAINSIGLWRTFTFSVDSIVCTVSFKNYDCFDLGS